MDNDELKSDIFQIKLDTPGRFNLSLPIYDTLSGQDFKDEIQYSELIIKTSHKTPGQDTVQEITAAVYSDGKVNSHEIFHLFVVLIMIQLRVQIVPHIIRQK